MKKIETNGKTVLFVEVPEGSKDIYIENNNLYLTSRFMEYKDIMTYSELPPGNWQILGKSTELTLEQMRGICKSAYYPPDCIMVYKDYLDARNSFETVQESYLSLLQANGIVDRNPHGSEEPSSVNYRTGCEVPFDVYIEEFEQWQEAQLKVKTYLILINENRNT